jgi:hypothetical protein
MSVAVMFPASLLFALHKCYERHTCWVMFQPAYIVSQVDSIVSDWLETFDPVHVALKRTQNC